MKWKKEEKQYKKSFFILLLLFCLLLLCVLLFYYCCHNDWWEERESTTLIATTVTVPLFTTAPLNQKHKLFLLCCKMFVWFSGKMRRKNYHYFYVILSGVLLKSHWHTKRVCCKIFVGLLGVDRHGMEDRCVYFHSGLKHNYSFLLWTCNWLHWRWEKKAHLRYCWYLL